MKIYSNERTVIILERWQQDLPFTERAQLKVIKTTKDLKKNHSNEDIKANEVNCIVSGESISLMSMDAYNENLIVH